MLLLMYLCNNADNNYIVAFYKKTKEKKSEWEEEIITFWEAVKRKKAGLPIVPPTNKEGSFLHFTLRQYDYVLLGLTPEQMKCINDPTENDRKLLHKHLYRVQDFSSKDYKFNQHTYVNEIRKIRIRSAEKFKIFNPIKVKVSRLG